MRLDYTADSITPQWSPVVMTGRTLGAVPDPATIPKAAMEPGRDDREDTLVLNWSPDA